MDEGELAGRVGLRESETVGQHLIAKRDFKAGEIVIAEHPVVTIDYISDPRPDGYKRRRAFMTLPPIGVIPLYTANMDLSYFFSPDPSLFPESFAVKEAKAGVAALFGRAEHFPELHNTTGAKAIHDCLVVAANAHGVEDSKVVLLPTCAKVTHLCHSPNLSFSIRQSSTCPIGQTYGNSGIPKQIALADIRSGEMLTSSYAELEMLCTWERRRLLMAQKVFLCQCGICVRLPDRKRGLICTACRDQSKSGTLYNYPDRPSDANWACDTCRQLSSNHSVTKKSLAGSYRNRSWSEARYSSQIGSLERHNDASPETLAQLYVEIKETIGTKHALAPRTCLLLLEAHANSIDANSQQDISEELLDTLDTLVQDFYRMCEPMRIDPAGQSIRVIIPLIEKLVAIACHDPEISGRCIASVTDYLERIEVVVQAQRGWEIGHAMQDDFDDIVAGLAELVGNCIGEEAIQGEEIGINVEDTHQSIPY